MSKELEISMQMQLEELVEAIHSVNTSISKIASQKKGEYYDKNLSKVLKEGFNIQVKNEKAEVKIDLSPIASVMQEIKNQNQILLNQNKLLIDILSKPASKQDNSDLVNVVKEMKELVRTLIESNKVKKTLHVERNKFSGFIEKINEA